MADIMHDESTPPLPDPGSSSDRGPGSNPDTGVGHEPDPGAASLSPEQKAELAIQRAAAADAWRAYVESGAVLHRQRSEFLERQFQLALKREQRAGDEIARLNWVHKDLVRHIRHLQADAQKLQEAMKNITLGQVLRRDIRERLEQNRLGSMILQAKRRLAGQHVRISESPPAPEAQDDVITWETLPATESDDATVVRLQPGGRSALASNTTILLICVHGEDTPLGRYSLDLLDAIGQNCNVIVWHLGHGPLLADFQAGACHFVAAPEPRHDYALSRRFVFQVLDQHPEIAFALVVGGELKCPLPALAERYVPVIGVVDEQITEASSLYAFEEILYWHTHTVFTSPAAARAVQRIYPYFNMDRSSVQVPGPGKRSLPRLSPKSPPESHLPPPLRRDAEPADAIIVGWGPVTYEAGVDLFISCADAMLRSAPGRQWHFLWLTQAAPEGIDSPYLQSIHVQIERMGLQERVSLVHAPLSDSLPLACADMVLFPARGDLLQHSPVLALQQGKPAIAFSGLTAVADSMQAHGLEEACLARPGDVPALAAKALKLLEDSGELERLSLRLRSLDWHELTLDAHVQTLIDTGRALKGMTEQERADEATIRSSGELRPDYMGVAMDDAEQVECSAARMYVRGWKAGVFSRKPRPGFQPPQYSAHKMEAGSLEDPFAHYLRNGSPAGPWEYPIIQPEPTPQPLPPEAGRVALHIHAYYPDMLEELVARLALNRNRPDLFISVKDEASRAQAAARLEAYPGKVAAIEVVPNRGRDIGPFLTTFGPALVRDFEFIGHLHTKASPHADRLIVERWRNFLLENLIGGNKSGSMMDSILSQLATHPDWAMAFPDDPLPLGWDTNKACAEALARHLMPGDLPEHFCFPVGTMFWTRAKVLRPFVELGLNYDDYPVEPLPVDGTLLHALERLFGVVPRALGMECALTSTPGFSR